jgi:uncharacterized protein YndB with AHSA1/START domain
MKPAEVTLPSDTEVRVSRTFNAPVSLVWRAFTEPELLKRWMQGPPGWTMPVCDMDVRPGGTLRWRWRNAEEQQEFGFSGAFQDVVPNQRLVHTELFDPGELNDDAVHMAESLVTVTFEETDGKTSVTTLISYKSKADRDAAIATGMTDGMEMSYSGLDDLLDAMPV